jgi:F0F1-type ATP synthase membrane subunit c/vacuolar-type H+-ATPase subunit K
MYLRRKCYSSLYDDLYNDYLYEKCYSDAYDYYTRLFSDDEDYSKQGALIGAGTALGAGGLVVGGDYLVRNKLDKIVKKAAKGEKLSKIEEKLLKKVEKSAENSKFVKEAIEEGFNEGIAKKNNMNSIKLRSIANKIKENKLAAAGIGAGTALGLTGAGYGLGKLKKRND